MEIVSIKGLDNNFMSNKSNNKYYSAAVLLSSSFTEQLIFKFFYPHFTESRDDDTSICIAISCLDKM